MHFWPCCSSPSGLSQSVSGCSKTERDGRRFWCLSCLALGPRGKKSWVKPGLEVPVHTVIQSIYFHLLAQSPLFQQRLNWHIILVVNFEDYIVLFQPKTPLPFHAIPPLIFPSKSRQVIQVLKPSFHPTSVIHIMLLQEHISCSMWKCV